MKALLDLRQKPFDHDAYLALRLGGGAAAASSPTAGGAVAAVAAASAVAVEQSSVDRKPKVLTDVFDELRDERARAALERADNPH